MTAFGKLRQAKRDEHRALVAPLINAIGHAGVLLGGHRPIDEACQAFLELPGAELCYLLDVNGHQIGQNLWSPRYKPDSSRLASPLLDAEGACWSRRPYFRRAIENIDRVQITRPYRTLTGHHQCITASVAFRCRIDGEDLMRVVCGDLIWEN